MGEKKKGENKVEQRGEERKYRENKEQIKDILWEKYIV